MLIPLAFRGHSWTVGVVVDVVMNTFKNNIQCPLLTYDKYIVGVLLYTEHVTRLRWEFTKSKKSSIETGIP